MKAPIQTKIFVQSHNLPLKNSIIKHMWLKLNNLIRHSKKKKSLYEKKKKITRRTTLNNKLRMKKKSPNIMNNKKTLPMMIIKRSSTKNINKINRQKKLTND
jgi:hypothetical protein